MGRFFGRDKDNGRDSLNDKETKSDYHIFQARDLYNKGINHMSNDKLEEAIRNFELAIRMDPNYVDAWIKKGYAHFHMEEYNSAITAYDKALDIDIDNSEGWNLKGLAFYKMKNYNKAIECSEKAIDLNPNDGMAWYNRACYLTLSDKVDDGMEALKRAIEIDISNAKKAVRDRDFENAHAEEGYMRILEVVALESIRHGNDYVGKIVWVTGMDKQDVEDALLRLDMKGLVIRREKRGFTGKEEYYELAKDLSHKLGENRRTGFLKYNREFSAPLNEIKDILEILNNSIEYVNTGDLTQASSAIDELVNPLKHGNTMIEQFFDQHRDLRLYYIRINEKGQAYLNSHKSEIIDLLTSIIEKVRTGPLSRTMRD